MAEKKNVRRLQEIDRANLTTALKTKMLGFANDQSQSLGFKRSSGAMAWFPSEGSAASYSSITDSELSGTGNRNVGVDSNGRLILFSQESEDVMSGHWKYHDTTQAEGYWTTNNSDPTLATVLNLSKVDEDGKDKGDVIKLLNAGGKIVFQDNAEGTKYYLYDITGGTIVDNGDYYSFDVVNVLAGTTPMVVDDVCITVFDLVKTSVQNLQSVTDAGPSTTNTMSYVTHPTFTNDTDIVDKKYVDDSTPSLSLEDVTSVGATTTNTMSYVTHPTFANNTDIIDKEYVDNLIADIGILSARYKFSTTLSGNPGTGHVGMNHNSPSSANVISINHIDQLGHDRSYGIGALDVGDFIALEDRNTSDHYTFKITQAPVDQGLGYSTVSVSPVSDAGLLNNNENITVELLFKGAKTFDDLNDTPDVKAGEAGKAVVVSDDTLTLEYADRKQGVDKNVENLTLEVGKYLHIATINQKTIADIRGTVASPNYDPGFILNVIHAYNEPKVDFALTHYTNASGSQFDQLVFTQATNGDPYKIYLRIANVDTNPLASLGIGATYDISGGTLSGLTLVGSIVSTVSNADLTIDITDKDFRWTNVAPTPFVPPLWSNNSLARLYPEDDYDRTDIGFDGTVNYGGKFNVKAGIFSGNITIAGSDVADANGEYVETTPGSNVWKHASNDWYAKMIGNWNWVVSSTNDDDWNNTIAYKTSNLTTPVGNYNGYNGHTPISITGDVSVNSNEYNDAIAASGSIYASESIKTSKSLNIGEDIVYGKSDDGTPFVSTINTPTDTSFAIVDHTTPIAEFKTNGKLTLPECDVTEITDDRDVATKKYVDDAAGSKGLVNQLNVSDGVSGWNDTNASLESDTVRSTLYSSIMWNIDSDESIIMSPNYDGNHDYSYFGVTESQGGNELFKVGGTDNFIKAPYQNDYLEGAGSTDDEALATKKYVDDNAGGGSQDLDSVLTEGNDGGGKNITNVPEIHLSQNAVVKSTDANLKLECFAGTQIELRTDNQILMTGANMIAETSLIDKKYVDDSISAIPAPAVPSWDNTLSVNNLTTEMPIIEADVNSWAMKIAESGESDSSFFSFINRRDSLGDDHKYMTLEYTNGDTSTTSKIKMEEGAITLDTPFAEYGYIPAKPLNLTTKEYVDGKTLPEGFYIVSNEAELQEALLADYDIKTIHCISESTWGGFRIYNDLVVKNHSNIYGMGVIFGNPASKISSEDGTKWTLRFYNDVSFATDISSFTLDGVGVSCRNVNPFNLSSGFTLLNNGEMKYERGLESITNAVHDYWDNTNVLTNEYDVTASRAGMVCNEHTEHSNSFGEDESVIGVSISTIKAIRSGVVNNVEIRNRTGLDGTAIQGALVFCDHSSYVSELFVLGRTRDTNIDWAGYTFVGTLTEDTTSAQDGWLFVGSLMIGSQLGLRKTSGGGGVTMITQTGTWTSPGVGSNETVDISVTVTGAVVGDTVIGNPTGGSTDMSKWMLQSIMVTADDTVVARIRILEYISNGDTVNFKISVLQ